jgi:S-adenosylmethionine synthetase
VSVTVDTFGTAHVDPARLERLVMDFFDLRPAAILKDLNLRRPIYRETARHGHFGRDMITFTWEKTDKADALRREAGTPAMASR